MEHQYWKLAGEKLYTTLFWFLLDMKTFYGPYKRSDGGKLKRHSRVVIRFQEFSPASIVHLYKGKECEQYNSHRASNGQILQYKEILFIED